MHFISFGTVGGTVGARAEATIVKEQNEKMLASVAAATLGTIVSAKTVVDLIGEVSLKTTNPVQVGLVCRARCTACRAALPVYSPTKSTDPLQARLMPAAVCCVAREQ